MILIYMLPVQKVARLSDCKTKTKQSYKYSCQLPSTKMFVTYLGEGEVDQTLTTPSASPLATKEPELLKRHWVIAARCSVWVSCHRDKEYISYKTLEELFDLSSKYKNTNWLNCCVIFNSHLTWLSSRKGLVSSLLLLPSASASLTQVLPSFLPASVSTSLAQGLLSRLPPSASGSLANDLVSLLAALSHCCEPGRALPLLSSTLLQLSCFLTGGPAPINNTLNWKFHLLLFRYCVMTRNLDSSIHYSYIKKKKKLRPFFYSKLNYKLKQMCGF